MKKIPRGRKIQAEEKVNAKALKNVSGVFPKQQQGQCSWTRVNKGEKQKGLKSHKCKEPQYA